MNTKTFLSILLVATAFISCKKELEPQAEAETRVNDTIVTETVAPAATAEGATMAPQTLTAPQTTQTTQTTQSATPAKNVVVGKGMNPPHGQPNHRCDIAVGAPLSGAATKPATQPMTIQTPNSMTKTNTPQAVPSLVAPAETVTAPGMNPPHGEPGHSCSVAVGAPLPK